MATKKKAGKAEGRKAKLEAKLTEKVGPEVVETLLNSDSEELREKLSSLAKHEDETEEALEKDDQIKQMSEELKEAKAPYKETLAGIKLQRGFIAMLLRERGKKVAAMPSPKPISTDDE